MFNKGRKVQYNVNSNKCIKMLYLYVYIFTYINLLYKAVC